MNRLTADFLRRAPDAGRSRRRPVANRMSRPVFLDAAERHRLETDLAGLYDLLLALPERLCGGDTRAYGELLGLTPTQAGAARRTARPDTMRLVRADAYRDATGFKVLETNVTAALGGTGISWQSRYYLADPAVREFVADEGLACVDTTELIAAQTLAACRRRGGPDRPVLAVVESPADRRADPVGSDFMALRFGESGFDALACDVTELRRHGGRLWAGGRAVDVVYRMFLLEDLRTPADAAPYEDVLAAQEHDEILMLVPLDAEAYGAKAALGMLSDERNRALLSPAEADLVDRVLPWTRPLTGPTLRTGGAEVDTVGWCVAHRDELILKPNWLHGGAGITPGWLVGPDEWAGLVGAAVGGPYVVQERVRPVPEPFPDPDGALADWRLNWGVFLVGDRFGGVYVRGERDTGAAGVISAGNGASLGCGFTG